ncbi:hypothetical protein [Bradyrhizobium cenepequi]
MTGRAAPVARLIFARLRTVLDFLANIAVMFGNCCVYIADYHSRRRDAWIERGRFWSDVNRWLTQSGDRSFAQIRAERKVAER